MSLLSFFPKDVNFIESQQGDAWVRSKRLIYKYVNNALYAPRVSLTRTAGTNRWQLTYGRDQEDRLRGLVIHNGVPRCESIVTF